MAKTKLSPNFLILAGGAPRGHSHYLDYNNLFELQTKEIRKRYKNATIYYTLGYQSEKVYSKLKELNVRCIIDENYEFNFTYNAIVFSVRAIDTKPTFIVHGDTLEFTKFKYTKLSGPLVATTDDKFTIGIKYNTLVESFTFSSPEKFQGAIFLNTEAVSAIKDVNLQKNDCNRADFELYNELLAKGIQMKPYHGKTKRI